MLLHGTKGVAGRAGEDAPGKQAGVRDSRKPRRPEERASAEPCPAQMHTCLFLCGY